MIRSISMASVAVVAAMLTGCSDSNARQEPSTAQSCMGCHNGSRHDDYAGPGLENPHPFPDADNLQCTTCHGGNPNGTDKATSHVPPPPEIGDRAKQQQNGFAWFNKLTLAGIDKLADYDVDGQTHTALEYLQFLNPSDLRVVTQGQGCGQCHVGHATTVAGSPIATETGILSGATFAAGIECAVPASRDLYQDTASDLAFRAVSNPNHSPDPSMIGAVGELIEFPVFSTLNAQGPLAIHRNQDFTVANLIFDLEPDNRLKTDSKLAALYQEQVAFTCGDCHLGSSGANNRYGDFRPSGCAACHMRYSLDGRSKSRDPNVPKNEPIDPDDIDPPERAHVMAHRIASIAKTLPNGVQIQGIDDYACAGCHQGSNRTVMQYWGIRLDQNQDLRRHVQYPADPVSFRNTSNDPRLFDPAVGNRTFNGRNANQYIRFEDYDGDGRDDTPADVHYEAGMGCIDCHGTYDLHGGDAKDPNNAEIWSRMEHGVTIKCENCHGTIQAYAPTVQGTTYDGQTADLAIDSKGRPLPHVVKDATGYWLTSRLDGRRHYIPQTRDTVVDGGVTNPATSAPIYNPVASYAMGRADGDPGTGMGPQQTGAPLNGFSHTDRMDCASCHASWTNTCMGCHLGGEYNTGNNFSNITGDRIAFRQATADFTYQSPVYFQLGVADDGRITQLAANTKVFFQYRDINGNFTPVFSFTDRNGAGRNPARGMPSLSHNAMLAHSIRGRVSTENEGPRYCVACHLTTESLGNYRTQYDAFRTALNTRSYQNLDFNMLRDHIGKNPGNQIDSPLFVHMVAGLGSGLFLCDDQGRPLNPLDDDPNRKGAGDQAPSTYYDPALVAMDLDRIVEPDGVANGSNNHMLRNPAGSALRDGAADPEMCGPLGATLLQRLTDPDTGIVLNSWFDADGLPHGDAPAR